MENKTRDIPHSWHIVKFGSLGNVYNGLTGKSKDDFGEGEPYIPYTNVFNNSAIDPSQIDYVKITKGESQNKVKYGDLIFTTSSETIEEVGMTSIFLNENKSFYLNSFCFGFRLSDFRTLLPEFARYLFRAEEVRRKISLLGQGSTRYNLSKTKLLNDLDLLLPKSIHEQQEIAAILSKVDDGISKIEQLINKYKRIKTGLMQDLFTKGIDENGNIRSEETHGFIDSPLGRIPQEWGVESLNKITSEDICYGIVQVGDYDSDGVKTIAIKDLNSKYENVHMTSSAIEKRYTRSRVYGDEILISIKATTDKVDIVPKGFSGNISRDIAKLKISSENVPLFYKYYFLSEKGKKALEKITIGSTRKEISIAPLKLVLVLNPPKAEQERILNNIITCEEAVKVNQQQLSKLHSLKAGLMQDLLTGKVRVNHNYEELSQI